MQFYDEKQNKLSWVWAAVSDIKSEKKYRAVLKRQLASVDLTEEFEYLAAPETPVAESRHFLQEANNQSIARGKEREAAFLRVAEEAGISHEDATELIEGMPLCLRRVGEDILLSFGGSAVCENIVFCNADLAESIVHFPEYMELSKTETGYLLEETSGDDGPFSLHFTHAKKQLMPFHASCALDNFVFPPSTPWEYLSRYAQGIENHLRHNLANERELALCDVVEYLANEQSQQIPETFLELARRHGAERVVEKYAKKRPKMFRELSKQKYEPMWRELWEAFEASQEGLPQEWEFYCTPEQFEEHKRFVTVQMHLRGFEGEYPHFRKKAPFRRLALMSAFGESFFVGFEKYASHHIYCRAVYRGDENGVGEKYICGTVFRKTAEEETDIWSCFFDRRGKTNASEVYSFSYDPADAPARSLLASAAAKSAELRRLTKEERTLKQNFQTPAWIYILMFLFMGTFFGVFWTLGFILIISIITLLVTFSFAAVAEIILGVPWWLAAVASGVLFALPMTVIVWITDRK